jgi:hypothetical protein
MSLVTLHVYDITNTQYETANAAIQGLNRFTKDTLGAGGIFHGAVEVNGDEWSYGYCDRGTGVSSCDITHTVYSPRVLPATQSRPPFVGAQLALGCEESRCLFAPLAKKVFFLVLCTATAAPG